MSNFSDMLSTATKMQEKMKESQDKIKNNAIEASEGGDQVNGIIYGVIE